MKTEISQKRNPKNVSDETLKKFINKGEIPFIACGTVFEPDVTTIQNDVKNVEREWHIYIESESCEFRVGWLTKPCNSTLGKYRLTIRKCALKDTNNVFSQTNSFNDVDSALSELDNLIFHPNIEGGKVVSLFTKNYKRN